ncbi:MAG: AAA family ATPase, partial [Alphaproteobacteria bacterium]|nr:AAA family ATPase [Alphaproteobacteria bacterium]
MDSLVAEGSRAGAEAQASAPGICAVGRLKLAQFRNYETLDLETTSSPVVLVGPNGAGKTNILEAISFLAPGKGLRSAAVNEPQRMGSDACWAVFAQVGDLEIGT